MRIITQQHDALDLPKGRYSVILADCPWTFETYSGKGKGKSAEQHYNTMSLEQIKAMPVKQLARADCSLFMWVTWPLLQEGLDTMKAWGFEYKTCAFTWMKLNQKTKSLFMGMGMSCTRANSEVCLYATRGHPKRLDGGVPSAVLSKRREHSRKPDIIHNRIERLFPGPRIELFGRAQRDNWTVWGAQQDKFSE